MCGIVGYIGDKKASEILIEGLKRLEYRGYDSAGIAIKDYFNNPTIIKAVGKINELIKAINEKSNVEGSIGIGHTRWATHGKPTIENAHPHYSDDYNVIGVHNGIIENYQELKDRLTKDGYLFYSKTDTEVLIKLIDYYATKKSLSSEEAIKQVLKEIKGSFAVALLFENNPNRIYFMKKGSPLIIAKGNHESFLASDVSAIINYSKEVYYVNDNEYGYIEKDKVVFFNQDGEEIKDKKLASINYQVDAVNKGNYPHYMLKEINEQPKAILDTLNKYIHKDVIDLGISKEELAKYQNIYIVACGSAYHTGLVAQYIFEDLCNINVRVELASEFKYRKINLLRDSLAIFVSQSGETKDTLEALLKAKGLGIKCLSIVNVYNSAIAREADINLYTYAGPEIAVATTKAYSCQLIVFYLLALNIALAKGLISEDKYQSYLNEIKSIPNKIEGILSNTKYIESLASNLTTAKDIFFIGRGIDYAICMEGSLKLKEVSYIHSEAFAAGELKHGTISLIDDKVNVIAIMTQQDLLEKTYSNAVEVKAREGHIISLSYKGNKFDEHTVDYQLSIPTINHYFIASLAIIPLQLLAYYVSINKGIDPDKPKNLAKSVTVE